MAPWGPLGVLRNPRGSAAPPHPGEPAPGGGQPGPLAPPGGWFGRVPTCGGHKLGLDPGGIFHAGGPSRVVKFWMSPPGPGASVWRGNGFKARPRAPASWGR